MKISFVGHAAILVEAAGMRILSDPWWKGPCFGAQWWVYPTPDLTPLGEAPVDYVYVSHGHHDHLHPTTLKSLAGSPTLLVSSETDLAPGLRDMGFEVIELGPDEERDLGGGVCIRIHPTTPGCPPGSDTLMGIRHENQVALNLNDAVHALDLEDRERVLSWLQNHYPNVDALFCGYGTASYFPNCIQVPGKDDLRTAIRRQGHFNRAWCEIVHALAPKDAFPFAADVALLETELIHFNEAVHAARPTDLYDELYAGSETRTHDMAPGFVIEDGEVVRDVLRHQATLAQIEQELSGEIERANRTGRVAPDRVERLVNDLRENAAFLEPYLSTFEGDYRCLIDLRNSERGIAVEKSGRDIRIESCALPTDDPDAWNVILRTRSTYLHQSLTRPFGDEVIFVGSGGLFRYAKKKDAARDIHHELRVLISLHERVPERIDMGPRWLRLAKDSVKALLGRKEEGLYDLLAWTVFKG